MSLAPLTQLTAKLAALAQRLRPSADNAGNMVMRMQAMAPQLSAPALPIESIWWDQAPALHALFALPRGALSGPVQEDKANAHQALKRLVHRNQWESEALDLRSIDGLAGDDEQAFTSLEHYSAARCRHIRIISFNDLQKALGQLFTPGQECLLNQASWRGSRMFWAQPQQRELLASVVAYARLRQLSIERSAVIDEYHFNAQGVSRLSTQFHVLAMPSTLWAEERFLALLVEFRLPYSRLKMPGQASEHDWLILPKNHCLAHALGQNLTQLGATHFSDYLNTLTTPAPLE